MTTTDQDDTAEFRERAVMSIVTELADLEENARRLRVVVTALASTYNVPTAIDSVSAIVK